VGAAFHVVIVATGSEVALAQEAAVQLAGRGIPARVVSMPCVERFQAQPEAYRRKILPPGARVALIEAAQTDPWCSVIGGDTLRIGLNRFGASAPAEVLAEKLGFTPDAVASRIALWIRPR
jgi:transketolase